MTGTNHGRRRATAALTVTAAVASLVSLVAPTGIASAGTPTLVVDDDRAQCRQAGFTTIQAAVDAAVPGSRITVCAGTYAEQVTFPAGKNGLTLESKSKWTAVIKAPAAMLGAKAIVHVAGALAVTIREFTIAGSGGGACDLHVGVLVDSVGTAGILKNRIVDVRNESLGTCEEGNAVQIGSAAGPGGAVVKENIIERYQETGVAVTGGASLALVEKNVVTGVGPSEATQNGIQIADGASAVVKRNIVSDNLYSPLDLASSGILVWGSGAVDVEHNSLTRNGVGVYVLETHDVTVRSNKVSFSSFDGIALLDSAAVDVIDNRSTDNGAPGTPLGPGIGVYRTTGSLFDGNRLERNEGGGLLFDDATADNTVGKNVLRDNAPFDCEDASIGAGTSGTANIWSGKDGETESVPGLCTDAEPLPGGSPVPAPPQGAPLERRPPPPAI